MIPHSIRSRWRSTLGFIMGGVFLLTVPGCAPANPLDANWASGDDTPFEQRQTVEEYAEILPPAILQLQENLTQAGSGPWERGKNRYQFEIHHCKENRKEGYSVRTSGVQSGPVSVETMIQLSTEVLAPLGYTMGSRQGDEAFYISWVDWRNGGYIQITVHPERTGLSGRSECRPGSDFHGTRAKLRALMPLPTETPSNTPTKNHHTTRPRHTISPHPDHQDRHPAS